MKRSCLLIVSLVLLSCSSAVAQQSFLVVQDDRNEPCRRFKMRVLVPVGLDGLNPQAKRAVETVDYKMRVWNPCYQNEPQFALLTPSSAKPDTRASIFSPKSSKVPFPVFESSQKKPVDFFQPKPSWSWDLRTRRK